jgi:hypothetical protein
MALEDGSTAKIRGVIIWGFYGDAVIPDWRL